MRAFLKTIPIALLALGLLSLPASAAMPYVPDTANSNQQMAFPGALNYVEGTAHLEGRLLNDHKLQNLSMQPGQVLTTQTGKAEILLVPGVYLRVGDHSAVKMISPDIANTKVQLVRGEAAVEVDELHSQNDLQIVDGKVTIRLVRKGFYEFTANPPRVRVFSGRAEVAVSGGRYKEVKGRHEMALSPGAMQHASKFKINDARDDLYRWSKLRSQYQAEARAQTMDQYGGWGWAPGYWDGWGGPWWGMGYWGGWGWSGFWW